MRDRWIGFAPSLLAAAGVLAGTVVAGSLSGWGVVAGPLVMAGALLAADEVGRRRGSGAARWPALIVAASLLAAGALLAASDPARVVTMMPILGAAGAAPVVLSGRRCGPGGAKAAER